MKLLTKFLLPILIAMIGVSQVKADSITVVSTGSKTGSYTMQSVSYSKDLKKYYNVDLIIPGGHCKAIPLIKKIKTPTIIPWASDFESIGRDGIYDGNGAGRAALINGEVDYYITSPKHAKYIETNGGQCFYELSSLDKQVSRWKRNCA